MKIIDKFFELCLFTFTVKYLDPYLSGYHVILTETIQEITSFLAEKSEQKYLDYVMFFVCSK